MKNENLLILTFLLVGLTWGALNMDYRVSKVEENIHKRDTMIIQNKIINIEERH